MIQVNPRVSYVLIIGALLACVVVAVLSSLARDWPTVWAVGVGGFCFAIPLWLLRRGRVRAANLLLMLIVLATVTAVATVGQGLHDTALMSYPIVLVYVGLTSDRPVLILCAALTVLAGLWLAAADSLGWFVPVPVLRLPFDYFSLVTLTILSAVGAVAVDLLSSNMRRSLEQARHEIEERKRSEEQRARLSAQLAQAQKMESVGRLAGGVAHDFNNMLGVISGHAEMALQDLDVNHPLRESLEEIRKAAAHSAELTRQLLAFARRQVVAPRVLDLNQTVEGMLKMLQRLVGEAVCLDWKPSAGTWPVRIDPSQVDQMLVNLCVNARDAIGGSGTLGIATGNCTFDGAWCADHPGAFPGDYVVLAVSDDGRGMDTETVSHLFEPFFTTKPLGEGTGLGLATVYGVVKQNGGFIDVRSEPGLGSVFRVYLPRHTGAIEHVGGGDSSAPLHRGSETLLVVEDEGAILKLAKSILERQGYTVLAAASPGDALRLAAEPGRTIDLLMTDVVMPGMNGHDLAEALSQLHPGLKCLFMSGYTADIIADHGVLKEGVSFIQKPFSVKLLTDRIRETLDR